LDRRRCFGSKYYETPNIDRLATQGTKFTNGYTCGPNCQPTRAALLSGQYEPRTGVYTVGNINRFPWQSRPLRPIDNVTTLPLEKITIAQAMKDAGYATGMFGKWHLGPLTGNTHPAAAGFDEAIESSGKHFDFATEPENRLPQGAISRRFPDRSRGRFHHASQGPAVLSLSPALRRPRAARSQAELIEKFKKKQPVGGHKGPDLSRDDLQRRRIRRRIMQTLEDLKLADNTLLSSPPTTAASAATPPPASDKTNGITDNSPAQGRQRDALRRRRPRAVHLPLAGHIAADALTMRPIITVDVYPTLLDSRTQAARKTIPLDGVSIVSLLTEKKPLNRDALYWHFPATSARAATNGAPSRRRHPQRRFQAHRVLRRRENSSSTTSRTTSARKTISPNPTGEDDGSSAS
jgi:arylsulfatase A-like enzyme